MRAAHGAPPTGPTSMSICARPRRRGIHREGLLDGVFALAALRKLDWARVPEARPDG